jgi:hypothetical protein
MWHACKQREMHVLGFREKIRRRGHFEDTGVCGIYKVYLKEIRGEDHGMDLPDSRQKSVADL